jgi:F-type H+-transporting ATPase subunit b
MFVTAALAATDTATQGDAVAHGAEAAHGGGVFPPFDPTYFPSQLFWLCVSFGLFYLFMSRVVLPRIGEIIETRRDRIAHDIDEANAMKAEADAALAAYEQSLASARSNASDVAGKARDKAKAEAEDQRQRVEAELAARMVGAEKRIGEIKTKAMAGLDGIAEETAAAIVDRLLNGKFAKSDITAAVKAARAG